MELVIPFARAARRLVLVASPLVLAAAACGERSPEDVGRGAADTLTATDSVAPDTGASMPEQAAVEPPDTAPAPAAEEPSAPPAAGREVRVSLSEWRIDLAADTLPAGPTTFRAVNRGTETHGFEVESARWEYESAVEEIEPGAEITLYVELKPGEWTLYCPRATPSAGGGHARRGMRRTIVVR